MNGTANVRSLVISSALLLAASLPPASAAMAESDRSCCSVGMARAEETDVPRTQGRREIGEPFTCPIDGMTGSVSEDTPATEFRGMTYYFCNEDEKRLFLDDPDRYVGRR